MAIDHKADLLPPILIVDDSPVNIKVLSRMLSIALKRSLQLNFVPVEDVCNGKEAVDAVCSRLEAQEHAHQETGLNRLPDLVYGLILMDVSMPVMDGLTVSRGTRGCVEFSIFCIFMVIIARL